MIEYKTASRATLVGGPDAGKTLLIGWGRDPMDFVPDGYVTRQLKGKLVWVWDHHLKKEDR